MIRMSQSLDLGFRWQQMCFSDKKGVIWRNPCYFFWEKNSFKSGTMLMETVLFGDLLHYRYLLLGY